MLGEFSFSVQNIIDNDGVGMAITGMSIVFTALALITCFIAALPKVLAALEGVMPVEAEHHAPAPAAQPDDKALAVAIGFALHCKAKDEP